MEIVERDGEQNDGTHVVIYRKGPENKYSLFACSNCIKDPYFNFNTYSISDSQSSRTVTRDDKKFRPKQCELHALPFCGLRYIVCYSAGLCLVVYPPRCLFATCFENTQWSIHVHDAYFPNNTYNIMQNKSSCDRLQPLNAATAGW